MSPPRRTSSRPPPRPDAESAPWSDLDRPPTLGERAQSATIEALHNAIDSAGPDIHGRLNQVLQESYDDGRREEARSMRATLEAWMRVVIAKVDATGKWPGEVTVDEVHAALVADQYVATRADVERAARHAGLKLVGMRE